MNTNNPSDRTVKSFSAGYATVNVVLDASSCVTAKVSDVATATKDTAGGFFSGMRYAIAERRGTSTIPAAKNDDAKLHAARNLYARAHAVPLEHPPVPVTGTLTTTSND